SSPSSHRWRNALMKRNSRRAVFLACSNQNQHDSPSQDSRSNLECSGDHRDLSVRTCRRSLVLRPMTEFLSLALREYEEAGFLASSRCKDYSTQSGKGVSQGLASVVQRC